VPPSVLKSIITPLVHVFNLSFHHGQFPARLKLAKVGLVPIYKNDDKLSVCNYRPISVLSVFSEVLEKLMFKIMSIFIENIMLFSQLVNLVFVNITQRLRL